MFFHDKRIFFYEIFCFKKVELPAYSSTEHSHIAHQIRVALQAESSCDVKICNLQGKLVVMFCLITFLIY